MKLNQEQFEAHVLAFIASRAPEYGFKSTPKIVYPHEFPEGAPTPIGKNAFGIIIDETEPINPIYISMFHDEVTDFITKLHQEN